MRAKFINENMNFERPESEKEFKDTLFKKYLKIIESSSNGLYRLQPINSIIYRDTIKLAYAKIQNYFWTLKDYSNIEILDKYDIPYEIKRHHRENYISEDDYIIIEGKYVDWGNYSPVNEIQNFERPASEEDFRNTLFNKLSPEQKSAIKYAESKGWKVIDLKDYGDVNNTYNYRVVISDGNNRISIYPSGTDIQGLSIKQAIDGWWMDPAGGTHPPSDDEDDEDDFYDPASAYE